MPYLSLKSVINSVKYYLYCLIVVYVELGRSSMNSVSRLSDFLHFGQLFKPLATISFAKSLTFIAIFVTVPKSLIFLVKSILGNFYRHFVIFIRSSEIRRLKSVMWLYFCWLIIDHSWSLKWISLYVSSNHDLYCTNIAWL